MGSSFYEIDSAKSVALAHHFVRAAPVKQAARLTGQDGGLKSIVAQGCGPGVNYSNSPPALSCRLLFNQATNSSIS
jgi:hypothetical protein